MVASIRAIDVGRMSTELHCLGVSPGAVDAALARLAEVADLGMITGQAWPQGLLIARN
ncbi:hypothetical protein [Nocardia brasiliensis]|uniref:hypothetical protein n=1 Tax=Nocardia brasiliensis TaxID=37326 RepID=UPI0024573D78|nr:hypothetical protein [Nocardia brasiliensis]